VVFAAAMFAFVALFVVTWGALIVADVAYTDRAAVAEVLHSRPIRAALWLSVWTSLMSVAIGLVLAIPCGYALSRYRFFGKALVEAMIDLPILMPPLIVGLSLLVFFQTPPGQAIERWGLQFVFQPRGIVLCQVLVSVSFGIRAMKLAFDGVDPRLEHVALTLGSSPAGAFFRVSLPLAWRGVVTAGALIWTRALGIFGPLMVLVGVVRERTEVLPTTIYLEQSIGRIEVALAVALLMMGMAATALVMVRVVGLKER